jgi:hypothetical protein
VGTPGEAVVFPLAGPGYKFGFGLLLNTEDPDFERALYASL